MARFTVRVFVIILLFSKLLVANETYQLPDLNVIADPLNLEQSQDLSDLQIISQEQLKENNFDLESSLSQISGLHLNHNSSATSSLFIRGGSSSHVLVLIDGMPANDSSDSTRRFDFSTIDMEQVERIEVIKSGLSSIYGSDALAGVVNIITKRGTKNNIHFTFNSNLERSGAASIVKHKNSYYIKNYLKWNEADGSSALYNYTATEKDYKNNFIYSLQVEKSQENDFQSIKYQYVQSYESIDEFPGSGEETGLYTKNKKNQLQYNLVRASTESINEWKLQYNSNLRESQFSASSYGNYESYEIYTQFVNTYQNNSYERLFGLDSRIYNYKQNAFATAFSEIDSQIALFQQSVWKSKKWSYGLGLRYDFYKSFGDQFSPKASVVYSASKNSKIKCMISSGFKAPTVSQLMDPSYGNKDLLAETVESYNLEFDYSKFDFKLNLGLFLNNYRNFIQFESTRYENSNKAKTQGMDISISYQIAKSKILWSANILDSLDYSTGEELLLRPQFQSNLNWIFKEKDWTSNLEFKYVGKRTDFGSVDLQDYDLVNLYLNRNLDSKNLAIKLINIFNKQYQTKSAYDGVGRYLELGFKYVY